MLSVETMSIRTAIKTLSLFLALMPCLMNNVFADSKMDAKKAAKMAQRDYGGKVLNVNKSTKKGKETYRVKLLLDGGKVKTVTVP